MRIDDQDEFIDRVAQTVIDRIEERSHMESLASLVVSRVLALQQEKADALAEAASSEPSPQIATEKEPEDKPHV